jgi:ribose/xylose/arabinose/galactoside ABC-type transport system permease subunit
MCGSSLIQASFIGIVALGQTFVISAAASTSRSRGR